MGRHSEVKGKRGDEDLGRGFFAHRKRGFVVCCCCHSCDH